MKHMWPIVILLLIVGGFSHAETRLVDRLEAEVQKIPLIDTHNHLRSPDSIAERIVGGEARYDVAYVLSDSTYVGEFLGGGKWPLVKERLAVNAHHAYYRPIRQAFCDLYGLGQHEELNDDRAEKISLRMDTAHRRPDWYREILRRANISHVIWVKADFLTSKDMPLPIFHPMWNVDRQLVFVAGVKRKTTGDRRGSELGQIERQFEIRLESLADMERFIDDRINQFLANGGVGLKSTAAYFRPLDFDVTVDRHAAAEVFEKVRAEQSIDLTEQQLLEDYLMGHVLAAAARNKCAIQFHTGNQQRWNLVANAGPLLLNPLLYSSEYHDARFVLLHGGYPYTEQTITLVRYFPNAYLDLAWMPLFSPAAAKRALSDAFDMLDGRQLMIGTDAANLEETYGVAKYTRRIIAEVLAEKIENGYWTEEVALQAARRILYQNAAELYGLPLR